jgi:hypothetical protein
MLHQKMIDEVRNLLTDYCVDYPCSAYADYQEVDIDDLTELPPVLILIGEFELDVLIVNNETYDFFVDYKQREISLHEHIKENPADFISALSGLHSMFELGKVCTYRKLFNYLRKHDGETFNLSTLYNIVEYMKNTKFSCDDKDIIQHIESKSMTKSARKTQD